MLGKRKASDEAGGQSRSLYTVYRLTDHLQGPLAPSQLSDNGLRRRRTIRRMPALGRKWFQPARLTRTRKPARPLQYFAPTTLQMPSTEQKKRSRRQNPGKSSSPDIRSCLNRPVLCRLQRRQLAISFRRFDLTEETSRTTGQMASICGSGPARYVPHTGP